MSIEAGDAVWRITGDISPLDQALQAASDAVKSAMDGIQKHAQVIGTAMTAVGGTITGVLGIAVSEAAAAEDAQAQLAAVLKSTQEAAGLTADELNGMSEALAKTTKFEDDVITSAQSMLLTFTNIGEEGAPRATETVLDVAQAMGTDLKGASIQLGKALNDPIKGVNALADVGVSFTEDQKKMIQSLVETNQLAQAQTIILDELAKEFGGSAAAAANTLNGQLAQLKNEFGGLLEEIGNVLTDGNGLKGLVTALKENIGAMKDWIAEHPAAASAIIKVTAALGGFLFVAGPVVLSLGKIVAAYKMLQAITIGASLTQTVAGIAGVTAVAPGAAISMTALATSMAAVAIAAAPLVITAVAVGAGLAIIAAGAVQTKAAYDQLGESNVRLADQERGYLDFLIEKSTATGVALNEEVLARQSAAENIKYINDLMQINESESFIKIIERLKGEMATREEITQARNLALNSWVTQEEAARVALLNIDDATKVRLMQADQAQTDAMLRFMGVRTGASQAEAQATTQAAGQVASAYDQSAKKQSASLASVLGPFQKNTSAATDWAMTNEDLAHIPERTWEDVTASHKAALERQGKQWETNTDVAREANTDVANSTQDAGGRTVVSLDAVNKALGDVMSGFQNMPAMVGAPAEQAAGLVEGAMARIVAAAQAARQSMEELDMNVRHSPSINDRIKASTAVAVGLFGSMAAKIAEHTAATRTGLAESLQMKPVFGSVSRVVREAGGRASSGDNGSGSASRRGSGGLVAGGIGGITININGANQSPNEIAEMVSRRLGSELISWSRA